MKRTAPLVITAVVGFVLVASHFIPYAESWGEQALIWFDVLAAIAFVLGGGNLLKVQLRKISDRRAGWGYALVTLVAFLATLACGLLKIGVMPAPNQEFYGQSFVRVDPLELPEFRVSGERPEHGAERLPPSSARQLSFDGGELVFRGWMSNSQQDDLLDHSELLAWRCAVERLHELAQPPPELRGRLAYHAAHAAVGFSGWMSPDDEAALRRLNPGSAVWEAAVNALAAASRRETSVEAPPVPDGAAIPTPLNERVTWSGGRLSARGPLSAADRDRLIAAADPSPIAFPVAAENQGALLAGLGAAPLNEQQTEAARLILSRDWVDGWVLAMNSAGAPARAPKTSCELLAEQRAGGSSLDSLGPERPGLALTAAQIEAFRAFSREGRPDWDGIIEALKSLGPWSDAFTAAMAEFRSGLPTEAARRRELFIALAQKGPLSSEARERLTRDADAQHRWTSSVVSLFLRSHTTKYAWSGEFNQQGAPFWWLYEHVFQPITATMFALLAFYVASAAFRAFRAKNLDATLLLGTAFIILLGRTYAGVLVTDWLPAGHPLRMENLAVYVMKLFNSAGNRAIMIGIALGIASTSLKILLGIDRSQVGGGE